jgi:hypothetical protein
MTITTHAELAVRTRPAPRAGAGIGLAGVALGVAAGLTQLVAGSAIPAWSGNKLDTTGLGITTILLSLVAGVGLWQLRRDLPRWERIAVLLLVIACAAVCFTTVGRLWWIPGPLLIAAAVLAIAAGPVPDQLPVEADAPADVEHTDLSRVGVGGWLAYAVAVVLGLAVALSSLMTVLLGSYAPSVAVAAAVALVCGLALSAGVAPTLRRRVPAMLTGGFGAGLMAGGIVLGASAAMIVMS